MKARNYIQLCFLICVFSACSKNPAFDTLPQSTCNESDTTAQVTVNDIVTPVPAGAQTQLKDTYHPTKYLKINEVNVEIFGASGVSNWMMVQTYEMVRNILKSLHKDEWRQAFSGHQVFVITDSDASLPNGLPGQRNTGSASYTVVNEALVCKTAVDTIRPNDAASYRAWDTPIHEFGHAIDQALGLRESTQNWFRLNDPFFQESTKDEHLAWSVQNWFNADLTGSCGFERLDPYAQRYLKDIFLADTIWKPTCAGRP